MRKIEEFLKNRRLTSLYAEDRKGLICYTEWKLKWGRVEVSLDKEGCLCILWLNSIACCREGFPFFALPGDEKREVYSGSSIAENHGGSRIP
jgi:hypothetical protein